MRQIEIYQNKIGLKYTHIWKHWRGCVQALETLRELRCIDSSVHMRHFCQPTQYARISCNMKVIVGGSFKTQVCRKTQIDMQGRVLSRRQPNNGLQCWSKVISKSEAIRLSFTSVVYILLSSIFHRYRNWVSSFVYRFVSVIFSYEISSTDLNVYNAQQKVKHHSRH